MLLAEGLRFAVPLHNAEMWDWEPQRRLMHGLPAGWLGNVHRADSMLFRPSSPQGWNNFRLAFGTWARGLAVLAFEPGGVSMFDVHFCTAPHDGCPKDWTPREPVDVAAAVRKLDEQARLEGFDLPHPSEVTPMWEAA
jgi:hypothetical protein